MNKKMRIFIACVTLALFLVAGCSSKQAAKGMTDSMPQNYLAGDRESSEGWSGDSLAPELNATASKEYGKKIIYTAYLSVEVVNAKEAMEEISYTVAELGGYIAESDYHNKERVTGTITVRIPPENLTAITDRIGTLGKVLSSNLSSDDITFQYVDIESRLRNAQAQEQQLLALINKAVDIEDILAIRSELSIVQQEIEVYKGQLRYYDNMVDFSSVTIQLYEIYVPKSPEPDASQGLLARWGSDYIGSNIVKGFKNSVSFVVNTFGFLLIVLSYALIPLLIVGAIVFAITYTFKKCKNRTRKIKAQKSKNKDDSN